VKSNSRKLKKKFPRGGEKQTFKFFALFWCVRILKFSILESFSAQEKKERIKKRMEKKETAIIFTTLKHRFFVFTKSNE
jgi:hypothetical protein